MQEELVIKISFTIDGIQIDLLVKTYYFQILSNKNSM
jgi:hypothetical protein